MFTRLRGFVNQGGTKPDKVICGLGNPGPRYARTRHNAGYRAVERIAGAGGVWKDYRHLASTCPAEIEGVSVMLVRPLTYMNLSGEAVQRLLYRRWGLDPEDLLVIHDDLDRPAGTIRLRPGGSSGGHKGVQSIIDHLGSQNFARLRIGIGRPSAGLETVEYVLKPFSFEERPLFEEAWDASVRAAQCWLTDGIETAMNHFNKRVPGV